MREYSIETRIRKYVKGYWFLSFARKYKNTVIAYRAICCQMASKNVAHKASEFIVNKIVDVVSESNCDKIVKH